MLSLYSKKYKVLSPLTNFHSRNHFSFFNHYDLKSYKVFLISITGALAFKST